MHKNKDIQRFSIMVEPFGHRDLAANHSLEFSRSNSEFLDALKSAISEIDLSPNQYFPILDKCFLKDNNPVRLLQLVALLRRKLLLLQHPQLLRGALIAKPVAVIQVNATSSKGIQGVNLDQNGWELFGKADNFKGIGLWIDRNVLTSSNYTERQWLETWTFENISVPHSGYSHTEKFLDLRLSAPWKDDSSFNSADKVFTFAATRHLVRLFRETYHQGPRAARFFIPILINWSNHMEMFKTRPNFQNEYDPKLPGIGLDHYFANEQLNCLREIPGGDYVLASLIKRFYEERIYQLMLKERPSKNKNITELEKSKANGKQSENDSQGNPDRDRTLWNKDRFEYLYNYLIFASKWFGKLLRDDDKHIRYPDELLPRAFRRRYSYDLANVVPKKRRRPPELPIGLTDDSKDSITDNEND